MLCEYEKPPSGLRREGAFFVFSEDFRRGPGVYFT